METPTPSGKKHYSSQNDKKQSRLDNLSLEAVENAGGSNFIQASYFRYLCIATIGNQNEKLQSLQPNISIQRDSAAWEQALKLCLAFLRRRKMDQTLSAIRHEYSECPKTTGFSRASEIDIKFNQLLGQPTTSLNSTMNDTGDLNTIPATPK